LIGIVDQHIDSLAIERGDQIVDALLVGDVKLHDPHVERGELLGLVRVPGRSDHPRAGFLVLSGELEPQSAVCTRNQDGVCVFGRRLVRERLGLHAR
jgi:hypothetical protein